MSLKVPDTFNRVLIFPSMLPHLRLEHPQPPRRVHDAGFLNLSKKDRLNLNSSRTLYLDLTTLGKTLLHDSKIAHAHGSYCFNLFKKFI